MGLLSFNSLSSICRFHGRASRMEFWAVVLVSTVFYAILLRFFSDSMIKVSSAEEKVDVTAFGLVLHFLWLLPVLPLLATATRRAHDAGRDINKTVAWPFALIVTAYVVAIGWEWIRHPDDVELVEFLRSPLSGFIQAAQVCFVLAILALLSRASQPGPNKYGPNPHEVPT